MMRRMGERWFRRAIARASLRWIQPRWTDGARRAATSLQVRLLGCVALALIVSLALGGTIAFWNASRLCQTEMRAVLDVGGQTVRHALRDLSRSDNRRRDLEHLITAF